MADFPSWSPETLARFCEESQTEIVRLNNRHAAAIRHLYSLLTEFAKLSDECVRKPERNQIYRECKDFFESQ